MTWIIQLMIAVFMTVLYISISKELRNNSNILDRRLIYSLGLGMFSSLLFIFWIHQYDVHHTILYWRIVEFFKINN